MQTPEREFSNSAEAKDTDETVKWKRADISKKMNFNCLWSHHGSSKILSSMPKDKHNGFLHTEALLGHAWHTLQTLNKGNEHELAGEPWPRETEEMIESFVSPCSPLGFLSSFAAGYREKSCFLQWDTV